jgi:hypothetical protein
MRTIVIALALALSFGFIGHTAWAGKTILEKEYAGNVENRNKVGGGDSSAASDSAGRFAESHNSIAEGPPRGDSEMVCIPQLGNPSAAGCARDISFPFEGFTPSLSSLSVQGPEALSVNGYQVYQNLPFCPERDKEGDADGDGRDDHTTITPSSFQWRIDLERPVVSDLQLQICLDVRKCQEEEDRLGAANTVTMRDREDFFGWEAPPTRAVSISSPIPVSSGSCPSRCRPT